MAAALYSATNSVPMQPHIAASGDEAASEMRATSWCAVRVRTRTERIAARALADKGYEPFVPLYQERVQWSDRKKTVDVPLIPGYVMCRFELDGKPPILLTPGVIDFVRFGGSIAIITHEEIAALTAVAHSGLPAKPVPYLNAGERVRIHSGLLSGMEGILVSARGKWRVVVSVDILCRSVAVEVDRDIVTSITTAGI
jgi:transcription antitermination factor NusG